jgi:hypothetical protein
MVEGERPIKGILFFVMTYPGNFYCSGLTRRFFGVAMIPFLRRTARFLL